MSIEEPTVLLVDDDDYGVRLMQIVFEREGFAQPLQAATNGDEAIAYLEGCGRFLDRARFPMPAVVLLDLNMPGRSGFEVLEWIRRQPVLQRLPVYILSASSRADDVGRAYELGANSYLIKPGTLDGLQQMVRNLGTWLKLGRFAPPEESNGSAAYGPGDNGHGSPATFPGALPNPAGPRPA